MDAQLKSLGSVRCLIDLFSKKLMLLCGIDVLNCFKVSVNTFIMLQKISVSNRRGSFELYIHKKMYLVFHKKISSANFFNIANKLNY